MKVIFLDYGYSKSQTPQRIAERLQTILKANNIELLRNPHMEPREDFLVIRWGTPRSPELDKKAKGVLNRAEIIKANLDKRYAHKTLIDSEVNAPEFWITWEEAKSAARELGCEILRRKLHHTQGKDIIRLKPSSFLPKKRRHGYYVRLLKKDSEFRLHMMLEKCIGVAQKKPKSDANPLIWNYENGWDIVYIPREERESIANWEAMFTEANRAMKALGFDFGAVDLIMVGDKPYILEVNTAPKLHDTGRYVKPMVRWISKTIGKTLIIPEIEEEEA